MNRLILEPVIPDLFHTDHFCEWVWVNQNKRYNCHPVIFKILYSVFCLWGKPDMNQWCLILHIVIQKLLNPKAMEWHGAPRNDWCSKPNNLVKKTLHSAGYANALLSLRVPRDATPAFYCTTWKWRETLLFSQLHPFHSFIYNEISAHLLQRYQSATQ